jgi:hypothetical protein
LIELLTLTLQELLKRAQFLFGCFWLLINSWLFTRCHTYNFAITRDW